MTTLKNKTALITGASRGIGKAIALRYARLGADVIVNYNSSKAGADEVVKEIESNKVKAIAIKADVSKPVEIDDMFELALKTFGKIDIVVVNAGLELVGVKATDFTEMQFDSLLIPIPKGLSLQCRLLQNIYLLTAGSSTLAQALPATLMRVTPYMAAARQHLYILYKY